MNERKDVTKQEARQAAQANQDTRVLRPAVDICEDATGITLKADMPGVPKEQLNIHVDNDTLFIDGELSLPTREGMEALYADISLTRYQRSFSLSSELDSTKIEAGLRDGVLTLHIPKREEHKPRKIAVSVG